MCTQLTFIRRARKLHMHRNTLVPRALECIEVAQRPIRHGPIEASVGLMPLCAGQPGIYLATQRKHAMIGQSRNHRTHPQTGDGRHHFRRTKRPVHKQML